MEPDYPAAHSRDTTWYAVDTAGRVGIFDTGEIGPYPRTAARADYFDQLLAIADSDPEPEWVNYDRAAELGLYLYEHSTYDDPLQPYRRTGVPAVPVHVDQLPPAIREGCRTVAFAGVEFATAEYVQPVAHGPCEFWGRPYAYVEADGATVRPIPGREAEFAALVAQVRTHWPKDAARYRFEGPADAP